MGLLIVFDEEDEENDSFILDRENFSRENIIDSFGNRKVAVGRSLEIVQTGGQPVIEPNMQEYLHRYKDLKNEFDEPWYVFTRGMFRHDRETEWYSKPTVFEQDDID